MSQRFYSDEEAEAILMTASQRAKGGVSRDQLLKTAAELGISPEEVDEAEQTLKQKTEEASLRKAFHAFKRREFYEHLATYVVINSFLAILDLATSGWTHPHWFFYVVIGWGIGVAMNLVEVLQRSGPSYEKSFEKWKRKQRRKTLPPMELAAELASEWLEQHPGDAEGAASHVRSRMDIRKREAKFVVENELSRYSDLKA